MKTKKQLRDTLVKEPFTPFGNGPGLPPVDMRKALLDDGVLGLRIMKIELEKLAKWWAETDLNADMYYFETDLAPRTYHHLHTLAELRVQRIKEFIGKQTVDAIISRVHENKRDQYGEDHWYIYAHKDYERRDVLFQASSCDKDSSPSSTNSTHHERE